MSNLLFLLLVLACPLMMVFMMRGMHGGHGDRDHAHGGGCHGGHDHGTTEAPVTLDDLRRQRDELDRRIEEREADEQVPVGPAA